MTGDPTVSRPPVPAAGTLRHAVAAHASAVGMPAARVRDVIIAVQELAANAVRHGAGRGRLRMQRRDGALVCQVHDTGPEPRDGRAAARDGAAAGGNAAAGWPCPHEHGLWLARQLADEMSVTCGPGETCATVVFALR